jgi:L-alanine-DL-glutamate epimerase-like enolase superfamily enzyme
MKPQTRRSFFNTMASASALTMLAPWETLIASERNKVKITDIKTMVFKTRPRSRTYVIVKVETDSGLFGIGEAYGSPGVGVVEAIHKAKEVYIGKDPLEVKRLYTGISRGEQRYTDDAAHSQFRAASGIDVALWDLAGKILDVPTSTLLGGKFRDKVRLYDHHTPDESQLTDKIACRDWAQAAKERANGITAHKVGINRLTYETDFGYDTSTRSLSSKGVSKLIEGFENMREAIGWDHDIMIGAHWEFNNHIAEQIARGLEPLKVLFFEDPLPVAYNKGWNKLTNETITPICTGENWWVLNDARPYIESSAIDIIHPDLRNSGFTESKRMADLADLHFIQTANHNTGSVLNGMATVTWASTVRDYLACETVYFEDNEDDDVVLRDGPLCKNGYVEVPNKPGLGVELNPDYIKAHLEPGEKWVG